MSPAIVILEHRDGPRILTFTEGSPTGVFDARGVGLGELPPERDAVAADVDGDGLREVLLCGDDGVWVRGWESSRDEARLSAEPCAAIGAADGTLVTVGVTTHLWTLPRAGGAIVDLGAWGDPIAGTPRLAIAGGEIAVSGSEMPRILLRRGSSRTEIATGAPPIDIAFREGVVVWLTNEGITDALHRTSLAGADPRAFVEASGAGLVLGGDGSLRRGGGASVGTVPALAAAAADLDGDGCIDLALLTATGVDVVAAPWCAPPIAPSPPPDPPRSSPIPPPAVAVVADEVHRTERLIGVGGAFGGGLPGVWPFVPAFPALTYETTWGGGRARGVFGVDTSGFLMWVGDDVIVFRLVNLTLGAAYGDRDLEIGPIVTLGLLNAGVGVRAAWTPFPTPHGAGSMGLESRVIAFAGGAGEVDLLWVWRSPSPRSRMMPPVARRTPCDSVGVLIGAAGGFSSTNGSWEFVGRDVRWAPSGSPFVGFACEGAHHLLSVESAPGFGYLFAPARDRVHHTGSHTFGPMIDRGAVRFGPIGQIGVWTFGAGGRFAWQGLTDKRGRTQGLDLRAVMLLPYTPAWEFTASWGIWTDVKE